MGQISSSPETIRAAAEASLVTRLDSLKKEAVGYEPSPIYRLMEQRARERLTKLASEFESSAQRKDRMVLDAIITALEETTSPYAGVKLRWTSKIDEPSPWMTKTILRLLDDLNIEYKLVETSTGLWTSDSGQMKTEYYVFKLKKTWTIHQPLPDPPFLSPTPQPPLSVTFPPSPFLVTPTGDEGGGIITE